MEPRRRIATYIVPLYSCAYITELRLHAIVQHIMLGSSWSPALTTAPASSALGFWTLTGAIVGLLLLLHRFTPAFSWPRKPRKLPPGPRGLPVLGNALQLPLTYAERQFHEWGKTFGTHLRPLQLYRCVIVLTRLNKQEISSTSRFSAPQPSC